MSNHTHIMSILKKNQERNSEEKSQSSVNFMQPIDASAAICFGFIHVTRKQAIYWFELDLGTSVLKVSLAHFLDSTRTATHN